MDVCGNEWEQVVPRLGCSRRMWSGRVNLRTEGRPWGMEIGSRFGRAINMGF